MPSLCFLIPNKSANRTGQERLRVLFRLYFSQVRTKAIHSFYLLRMECGHVLPAERKLQRGEVEQAESVAKKRWRGIWAPELKLVVNSELGP